MQDKTWLLQASGLKAARVCINLVQEELGVKLPLTHPDFLLMLNDYADLSSSEELLAAVKELNILAGNDSNSTIVSNGTASANNTVLYNGKRYPSMSDGKKFSGLYRGQPIYK